MKRDSAFYRNDKPVHPDDSLVEFGDRLAPYGNLVFLNPNDAVNWDDIARGLFRLAQDFERMQESVELWFKAQEGGAS